MEVSDLGLIQIAILEFDGDDVKKTMNKPLRE
jgi:hypothetical protein